MNNIYKSAMTSEPINNYSICVLEDGEIRSMQFEDDIEKELVYVDIIPLEDKDLYEIESKKYVRYFPIVVVSKFQR